MTASSFSPGPGFSFPRSYCWGIWYHSSHEYAFRVDNTIVAGYYSVPDFIAFIILDEIWIPWTSHPKTLDHIYHSSFWTRPSTGEIHDFAIQVNFAIPPYPIRPVLALSTGEVVANDYYFELEHEPDDYWQRMGW